MYAFHSLLLGRLALAKKYTNANVDYKNRNKLTTLETGRQKWTIEANETKVRLRIGATRTETELLDLFEKLQTDVWGTLAHPKESECSIWWVILHYYISISTETACPP